MNNSARSYFHFWRTAGEIGQQKMLTPPRHLDPYLLNFVCVNINVVLSFALRFVKLRLNPVHKLIVLVKLNLFMTYFHYW